VAETPTAIESKPQVSRLAEGCVVGLIVNIMYFLALGAINSTEDKVLQLSFAFQVASYWIVALLLWMLPRVKSRDLGTAILVTQWEPVVFNLLYIFRVYPFYR